MLYDGSKYYGDGLILSKIFIRFSFSLTLERKDLGRVFNLEMLHPLELNELKNNILMFIPSAFIKFGANGEILLLEDNNRSG